MQSMISRIYKQQIRDKLSKFPAVAILGSRQCGKTTLAQQFNGVYFDMETQGSEARLDAEWETLAAGNKLIVDDLWLCGGYPDGGILESRMFPQWQRSYLEMLTTRDLPTWGLSAKPRQTMRLLAMLAAIHGQSLNASQLGASLSLDHKTVLRHCDFLEGAFLIRRLGPYFTNIKKRLVKTPRFFRTSDGLELDLVLDWGTERWAIEIKLTSNPSPDMIDRLHKAADMIDADKRILVCRIARKIPTGWIKEICFLK